MTALAQALLPQGGGAPTPGIAPGQESIGQGRGFGVSPGVVGSTIGGMMGRGLAGALTGSAFGPIGTIAGLIGSAIGYGIGNQGEDSGFGTPGFGGQTDPADASIGFSLGDAPGPSDSPDPSDGAIGGDFGGPGGPGSSDSSGPSGGSSGEGGEAYGGYVGPEDVYGPDPRGLDEGYRAVRSGEFVLRPEAVKKLGVENLEKLNSGKFNRKALAKALMGKK